MIMIMIMFQQQQHDHVPSRRFIKQRSDTLLLLGAVLMINRRMNRNLFLLDQLVSFTPRVYLKTTYVTNSCGELYSLVYWS